LTSSDAKSAQGLAHSFLPRRLPPELEALSDLALDLRWTWSHGTDHLWQALDRSAWEATANPWSILQTISQDRLEELAHDQNFVEQLNRARRERAGHLDDPGWYGRTYPSSALTIAYFSMEFGLGEALRLYAGGLGILAGDFLKAASDLAIPVVGVGLLFQEGYFRQVLNENGAQLEAYPYNDPAMMPIFPVRDRSGGWLSVPIELPGRSVLLRVWHAHVGRVDFFLLDSNHPLNSPSDRGIASKLYDAEPERRMLQEIALGVGGWRALDAMGVNVDVLHLNEGHVAFAALERARSFAMKTNVTLEEACWATRAGNVFTTHTPVAAAFDAFEPALVVKYFRQYLDDVGASVDDLLRLGHSENARTRFIMAFLASRLCGSVNAVSAIHEAVSKRLARPVFTRWPEADIPISHITNGVHTPSWDSEDSDQLWTRICGKDRWRGEVDTIGASIANASDEEIWSMRSLGRLGLVDYARSRLTRDLGQRGVEPDIIEKARHVLDPNALTIGLARRFVSYKRPTLMLDNPERLRALLLDSARQVQLVVAGKAHPQDADGKSLVQAFTHFARQPDLRHRVVFIEDYDITSAQHMVAGVDVWINSSLRPWEACGTSGMKILVNGGINLSTLDGWWAEAYNLEVGWAFGDQAGDGTRDDSGAAAAQLYDLLESEIVPEFYDRDKTGIPRRWLTRVRKSMSALTPRFSANRMVRDYLDQAYIPAAKAYRKRIAENARIARELFQWQRRIRENWPRIHFGEVHVDDADGKYRFLAELYMSDLNPRFVSVELYADPFEGRPAEWIAARCDGPIKGAVNGYFYSIEIRALRPSSDYTFRVVPYHPEAHVPLEENHILWQK
jgi:glycogen phosphorylase